MVVHTVLDKANSREKYGMMILFNIGLLSHLDSLCTYTVKNMPDLEEYADIYVDTINFSISGHVLITRKQIW